MSYCKETDGNLAALAAYEKEQDELEVGPCELEKAAEQLMADCSPDIDSVAFEAITQCDDAAQALAEIVRDYDDSDGAAKSNHYLVCKFLAHVRAYCLDSAEKNI